MGSFYDSVLVTAPVDQVVAALQAVGATGLATPAGPGLTVAYVHEGFDAAALTRGLDASALRADVHDSDVLWMEVWERGELVHEYCNSPCYFAVEHRDMDGVPHGRVELEEGDERWLPVAPAGVAAEPFLPFAVGVPDTPALLSALSNRPLDPETPTFNDGYLFANALRWDAMTALGLPARLLTTGYVYLSRADDPRIDYAALIPFGNATRPDPSTPKPVSRFTPEQLAMVREQSRMMAVLSGGPRHGEEEWVPFLAMLNGIDSGDGGSYRYVADQEQPGAGAWTYTPDEPPSDHPAAQPPGRV